MSPNSLSAAANVLAGIHDEDEDSGCRRAQMMVLAQRTFPYCTVVASAFAAAGAEHTCGMFLTYTAFLLESSSL